MFDNVRNLASLMRNAGEIKKKLEQLQAELGRKTVEADAGAGAVRVVMNGKLEVIEVRLDRPLIATLAGEGSAVDQQLIEDLIAAAVNAAIAKVQELVRHEMTSLTGGLPLPGMEALLGG